jgi:hypothetical protein
MRNRGRVGIGLELASKVADVNPQILLFGGIGRAPGFVQELSVGDDLAHVPDQPAA